MRWPWQPAAPKLDPELARRLMEDIHEQVFPGVQSIHSNRFEKERCEHCRGLHSRKCPAIAEVNYHENGKVARVVYWRKGEWDENEVLWLEDIVEAAAQGDET